VHRPAPMLDAPSRLLLVALVSSAAAEPALDDRATEGARIQAAHEELQIFDPDLMDGGHGKNYVRGTD
jgi:hypothetical protein